MNQVYFYKTGNRKIDEFRLYYAEGAELIGTHKLPRLRPQQHVPHDIVNWHNRNRPSSLKGHWLDHFIDDCYYHATWNALCPNIALSPGEEEHVWLNLERHLAQCAQADGIITQDFSVLPELFPDQNNWNITRNMIFAYACERSGQNTVPVASWLTPDDFAWCFDALPEHSTIALSTNGCLGSPYQRCVFVEGTRELVKRKQPFLLVICGHRVPEIDGLCDIMYYPSHAMLMRERISNGR